MAFILTSDHFYVAGIAKRDAKYSIRKGGKQEIFLDVDCASF